MLDFEMRSVGEAAAEIARGSLDANLDRIHQADTDIVPGVGIDDLDVLPVAAAVADLLVRIGDADLA